MRELAPGTDRYGAEVTVGGEGLWQFQVEAWGDPIAHWRHDAGIKVPRGLETELMLTEGALLFERAARGVRPGRAPGAGRQPRPGNAGPARRWPPTAARAARDVLREIAALLRDPAVPPWDRLAAASSGRVLAILAEYPLRDLISRSARYPVIVHRPRALYGAWYEFFPRSRGRGRRSARLPGATQRNAAQRRRAVWTISLTWGSTWSTCRRCTRSGRTARKGANNVLQAGPGRSGLAVGHRRHRRAATTRIHPDLGTFADFDAFVGAGPGSWAWRSRSTWPCRPRPDHPWVTEHPEWFTTRADGRIAYAENPPKKYQDIYPLNFDNDPEGIYAEVLRIVRQWMAHGVRIFRVDNPHTKPLPFWERLLAEIARTDPDVLFLAEAFTRPAMMHALAEIGFHQSYTYFTWRNSAAELTDYLRELSGPAAAYMRPNFFANTPDILHEYLQHGGPPAFKIRAVLAAMLSPTWGIYSGYELCENVPVRPGSEEYLDSEKYQYRPRDWEPAQQGPAGIAPYIARLNAIRKAHPALHWLRNLRFHHVDQPELICFSKRDAAGRRTPSWSS